jgi:hypothetical protein
LQPLISSESGDQLHTITNQKWFPVSRTIAGAAFRDNLMCAARRRHSMTHGFISSAYFCLQFYGIFMDILLESLLF